MNPELQQEMIIQNLKRERDKLCYELRKAQSEKEKLQKERDHAFDLLCRWIMDAGKRYRVEQVINVRYGPQTRKAA